MKTSRKTFLISWVLMLTFAKLFAQSGYDSLKIKSPKHYFNTLIVADFFRKPQRDLKDTNKAISKKLKSYGVQQMTLNFHIPLGTWEQMNADSTLRNSHLLLTGTYYSFTPVFEGISEHRLVKAGIGMRYIYNTGRKGVWFFDVSPFVTKDVTYASKPYYRMASTVVYSHNASANFNWRLGATKSFMWGNRYYLPFVGLRFGRLDKLNFSIQFPRYISLNVPVNNGFLSAYSMAQGGVFNFSNFDTLYKKNPDLTFHYSRYEINTGLRYDYRGSQRLGFFLAAGVSTRNRLNLYSESANANRRRLNYNTYFYSANLPSSLFVNLGLVLRLGRVRSAYNVKNLYDAADLMDAAGENTGNSLMLPAQRKKSRLNLATVQDLVDYNDF